MSNMFRFAAAGLVPAEHSALLPVNQRPTGTGPVVAGTNVADNLPLLVLDFGGAPEASNWAAQIAPLRSYGTTPLAARPALAIRPRLVTL